VSRDHPLLPGAPTFDKSAVDPDNAGCTHHGIGKEGARDGRSRPEIQGFKFTVGSNISKMSTDPFSPADDLRALYFSNQVS
jgi:hypothetical protein